MILMSNHKKGLLFFFMPLILLVTSIALYIIPKLIGISGSPTSSQIVERLLNIGSILLGAVSVLGMLPFVLIGIYYFAKDKTQPKPTARYKPSNVKTSTISLPENKQDKESTD